MGSHEMSRGAGGRLARQGGGQVVPVAIIAPCSQGILHVRTVHRINAYVLVTALFVAFAVITARPRGCRSRTLARPHTLKVAVGKGRATIAVSEVPVLVPLRHKLQGVGIARGGGGSQLFRSGRNNGLQVIGLPPRIGQLEYLWWVGRWAEGTAYRLRHNALGALQHAQVRQGRTISGYSEYRTSSPPPCHHVPPNGLV